MPAAIIALGAFLFAFFRELVMLLKHEKYRSLFFWAAMTLLAGTIFYSAVEGWSLLDSLYFSTVTLATVGFGDLVPVTKLGRAFTIPYVLFGLSIVATFASILARERFEIYETRFDRQDERKEVGS